jgi:hypothetical protein
MKEDETRKLNICFSTTRAYFLQIWLDIRNIMKEANLLFEMELIW